MNKIPKNIIKRVVPILILAVFLISSVFIAFHHKPNPSPAGPGGPVIIVDPNVPLSSFENAQFYVIHPDVDINDLSSITYDNFDLVGEGSVLYSGNIYYDPETVEASIQEMPDLSYMLSENEYIQWDHVIYNEDEQLCYVVGMKKIGDFEEIDTPTPESKDYIDLADYDVVGDGETDDNEALVLAISDATENDKPLYIPAGDYYSSKMIYINEPITIYGDGADSSRIVFKDDVEKIYVPSDKQRGIMTFNGNGLSIEGITIEYEANNYTPYTRQAYQKGKEGALFSLLDSSDVTIKDTYFLVSGSENPSVTCAWFKSEIADISNVVVENCVFENNSASSVGGALWISAHDNRNTQDRDIQIVNNVFSCNCHDEVFGIWGHNINDIEISGNEFSHPDPSTVMETLVSIGQYDGGNINNLTLSDNTFYANDGLNNAINIQRLSDDSTVSMVGNTIEGTLSDSSNFNCIGLSSCGSTNIDDTTIDLSGGNIVTSFAFDRAGDVSVDNLSLMADDCSKYLIIKSRYSTNFADSSFSISNSDITVNSRNDKKAQPTIQFPVSSSFSMTDTDIDTSGSEVHELVFQTLRAANNDYDTTELNLDNVSTDANIYFTITSDENRSISLSGVENNNYYFTFSGANARLDEVNVSDCSYDKFYVNYKNSTPSGLEKYTNELNVDH